MTTSASLSAYRQRRLWLCLTIGVLLSSLFLSIWVAGASAQVGPAQTAIDLQVEQFSVEAFTQPVDIASAGDSRLFIVERQGLIYILQADGTRLPDPFLDIRDRVSDNGGEQGLLGLVFAPNDPTVFYVNYTREDANSARRGDTVIARFKVSADDNNVADPDSEEIVLVVDQPYSNHNAGDLAFGPDGFLYVPLGDGGSGGDPEERAQNLDELLGKILRLNVTGQQTYTIPAGNPYADDNNPRTRAEIWSSGWRNPWRFSFDRATGEMWIGDVGQGDWEEIDHEPANTPGRNYGWDKCEGSYVYPPQNPPVKCSTTDDLIEPVAEYSHSEGSAVTGGFVYRGTRFPGMVGHYFYADVYSSTFWGLTPDGAGGWTVTNYGQPGNLTAITFGEDANGELFVADYGGHIYRLVDAAATETPTTTPTSPTPTATATLIDLTPRPPQSYLPQIQRHLVP